MDQPTSLTSAKPRQLTLPELQQLYPVDYTIDPETRAVHVSDAWRQARLVLIEVIPGRHVTVHRGAAPVFSEWFRRLRMYGLDKYIITVDGGFNPRFKRGLGVPVSEAGLSRHTRGIAIDLNAALNPRGHVALPLGVHGTLMPLVAAAYDLDIVWGGVWKGADIDPMHFEIGHQR